MAELMITKRDGTVLRVLLSDEDADLATLKWSMAGGKGKVGQYPRRQGAYMHHVVAERMGMMDGVTKVRGRWSVSIDHINGDKLDNRRENLRRADRREQMANPQNRLRRNNTSGRVGVSFIKKTGLWYASIMVDGKTKSLGYFASFEEACAARGAAEGQGG